MNQRSGGGYTLVELIVAVGLFAIIMTLASGAYLVMIGVNRKTQALATGMNNLSFVLESMTRSIRTGDDYSSGCTISSFTFTDQNGATVTYSRSIDPVSGNGRITRNGDPITATAVDVTRLGFCSSGVGTGNSEQARVTITVGGTVSTGPGREQSFAVETGATMRGSDI